MSREIDLIVGPDGQIRCVYSEAAAGLASAAGVAKVLRASHVEFDEQAGEWVVDLTPTGGPAELGRWPLSQRDQALAAEVAWINANVLGIAD